MALTRAVAFGAVLALLAGPVMGLDAGLGVLDRLLGSCWRGEVDGSGKTDTHCWRSALGGRFAIDSHEVRGDGPPYSGDAYYRWNDDDGQLEFWYFNSLGGVSTGTARVVADGLDFPEERYTAGGETRVFRVRMRWRGADAYDSVTEERADGEWIPFQSIRFERQ